MKIMQRIMPLMQFSTGRRIVAYRRVKTLAESRNLTDLVRHIERALEHEHKTRELENHWSALQRQGVYANRVKEIDGAVDQMLSGIRDIVTGQARGLPAHEPMVQMVEHFMAEIFPFGVGAVTSLPYRDQIAAVEVILAKMQNGLSPAVRELGLSAKLRHLVDLTAEYRRLVDLGRTDVDFAAVREARERGQAFLREIIAIILGRFFDSENRNHLQSREELLAPVIEQLDELHVQARARRSGPVRNSDEPVEPGDEPSEPGDEPIEPGDEPVALPVSASAVLELETQPEPSNEA